MNKYYKRLREIGKGGMANVYLARQMSSNKLVAVKVLKDIVLYDDDYIKRFFREARITAKLTHPNIVGILESNYSEGLCYIVTEYIDGGDLRGILKNFDISLRRKLEVINKVIKALDYAHQQGIVHRDVKPSNILLTKTLEPKLCDFGIATALWGQESRFTRTDETIGTIDYIAPEQKESSKDVDFRADLYSIGVLLYQVVTGRKPQGAFPPPIELNDGIPPRLSDCIMKCLQPIPNMRFKSAENLHRELSHCLALMEDVVQAAPASSTSSASPTAVSSRSVSSATAISSVSVNGGTGDTGQSEVREPPTVVTTSSMDGDSKTEIVEPSAAEPAQPRQPDLEPLIDLLRNGPLPQKISSKTRFLEIVEESHQERLLELLEYSDGFLKETIIEALGKIKSQESCSPLIELLTNPYYNKLAAAAIGEIGCKEAEYKLFNILVAENANSYIALLPLGKLNSLKSVKAIIRFLKNPHDWIREMALDALALMTPDEKMIETIGSVSRQDESAHIRAKAKKLLWRMTQ